MLSKHWQHITRPCLNRCHQQPGIFFLCQPLKANQPPFIFSRLEGHQSWERETKERTMKQQQQQQRHFESLIELPHHRGLSWTRKGGAGLKIYKIHAGMRMMFCTRLGEMSFCSCLTDRPGPALVLLSKMYYNSFFPTSVFQASCLKLLQV